MNHTQENIPERLRELAKMIPSGLSRALLENAADEVEQLRGKVYLATGFLEGMAERLDVASMPECAAADCRAMAESLRK